MNVILFGATGMVGRGVLRECLLDGGVTRVLAVGRSGLGIQDPKLRYTRHADFTDFSAIETELAGWDACFFCLGVSSVGMSEPEYALVTYDYAMAAARTLARLNPQMVFVYVSGLGTDSTESGRTMWARVKGRTENDILRLPFRAAYMFRPGYIHPMHGITSKTVLYKVLIPLIRPFYPLLRRLAPGMVTTSEEVGRAMLAVVRDGYPSSVIENRDMHILGRAS